MIKDITKNIIKDPIKSYSNAELLKKTIFSENRNLSGIYRWVNEETEESYVGSAMDLTKRIRRYYTNSELERNPRHINNALLKYGHEKFKLEILEYCDKDKLLEREQFYLDEINPTYNILKQAYSLEGFKHSAETIEKLRDREFTEEHRENLSKANTGRVFSEETLEKLSNSLKEYRKNHPLTPEAIENMRQKTTEREGVEVTLVNQETGEETNYPTQTAAAGFLGITRQAIKNAFNRESIVAKLYKVKRVDKTPSNAKDDIKSSSGGTDNGPPSSSSDDVD